tara:strand:+ start:68 stop:448 length:381 start_codon:yes stop_codon:yes gene_type:complete
MRLLFIFLFISGISYAQGKVVSRHDNGQKSWVNVYTGTGINEKLTKRYYYDEHRNKYSTIITYSTNGYPIEKKEYSWDDNKRYLVGHKTYSVSAGYKSTSYNSDGTLDDTYGNAVITYDYNAINDN